MSLSSTEEWRDIPGYEGYYQASSLGRIRSLDHYTTQMHPSGKGMMTRIHRGRVLKVKRFEGERYRVYLCVDGIRKAKGVAVLVALAFHGVPLPNKSYALHRDGDMYNNVPENLYWGDQAENIQDTLRHGHHRGKNKTHCPHGHELSGHNLEWNTTLGSRYCKACRKANAWQRDHRIRNGVVFTEAEKREYADMKYAEIMSNHD